MNYSEIPDSCPGVEFALAATVDQMLVCGLGRHLSLEPLLGPVPALNLGGIDRVIVGGESGPGARPMDPAWVRDLRDQCAWDAMPAYR